MTSMLDIVAEATSAATRGWRRARQAALGGAGDPVSGAVPLGGEGGQLARLIEAEIMPRLLASHDAAQTAGPEPSPLAAGLVPRLARALMDEEIEAALALVETLQAEGRSAGALMEGLLAPAIRLLGARWQADEIDFVDMTMAAWRCQQLVHALSARLPGMAPPPASLRRALILPAPGEQHVLGAMMVEDGFARAGWATRGGPALEEDALVALASRERFDVIGLSISQTRLRPRLAALLAALRQHSAGRPLLLVGGPAIPDMATAKALGADGWAETIAGAVALGEQQAGDQQGAGRAAVAGNY